MEKADDVNARDRRLAWIGVTGGLVGILVMNVAPLDALLPVNRALFAMVCILLAIWVVLAIIPDGDGS
ncbi:hypothetical protein [Methylobacterium iners]|uniref:Uncharacterized protein n=1 Tax=Methylobacterium iners TaxID=418707 RepID=A0ABQ4S1R1_9HYPH|nr:hypothetical protein [Methylobacterium iners]GJD95864.1 hypothetical protein OCOJLMKI_3080 [Methylobacterium iners]